MKIFLTGDTHFNHGNIIKGVSDWGFREFEDIEEMNETIIERWNEVVTDEDIVIHIGDFALCRVREMCKLVKRLNGKIIIIKGNHDRKSKLKHCGFTDVLSGVLKVDFTYKGKIYKTAIRHKPTSVKRINFIICGHSHTDFKVREEGANVFINVGVDVWDYYPVPLLEVFNEIDKVNNE